jgi:hypothetical protein
VLQEELAAESLVGLRSELQSLERALEVNCRLLEGELLARVVARSGRVADGLVDIAAGERLAKVMRELGHMRSGVPRVERLERLGDAEVSPEAVERVQFLVERLADERVRESIAAEALRRFLDDTQFDRLVEDREEPLVVEAGDALEGVETKLPAEDRGGGEKLHARLAQAAETSTDHVADALRKADLLEPRSAGPAHSLAAKHTLLDQVPDDLLDEERITFRLAIDRVS